MKSIYVIIFLLIPAMAMGQGTKTMTQGDTVIVELERIDQVVENDGSLSPLPNNDVILYTVRLEYEDGRIETPMNRQLLAFNGNAAAFEIQSELTKTVGTHRIVGIPTRLVSLENNKEIQGEPTVLTLIVKAKTDNREPERLRLIFVN